MKKALLYFILLIAFISVDSQSLVTNHSFEKNKYLELTGTSSSWKNCVISGTPDFFYFDETTFPFDTNKYIGGTRPRFGNAFAGIFCYRVNSLKYIRNVREYIQSPLKEPLLKDSLYEVKISICLDKESNVAIKYFGIYFHHEVYNAKKEKQLYKLHPQITFRKQYLSNYDWIELSSYFKAKGNEKYIILGHFKSDEDTRIKKIHNSNKYEKKKSKWNLDDDELASYYYIDNVIVRKMVNSSYIENEVETTAKDTIEGIVFDIENIAMDSAIILKNILFDFDKSELLPASYTELDKLVEFMTSNPNLEIRIEGHTDNIGTYEYNLNLSIKRARAVVEYLINNNIARSRLNFIGYGDTKPITTNRSEKGRKLNRRVVLRIIKK